jgi:hypothetical protein
MAEVGYLPPLRCEVSIVYITVVSQSTILRSTGVGTAHIAQCARIVKERGSFSGKRIGAKSAKGNGLSRKKRGKKSLFSQEWQKARKSFSKAKVIRR